MTKLYFNVWIFQSARLAFKVFCNSHCPLPWQCSPLQTSPEGCLVSFHLVFQLETKWPIVPSLHMAWFLPSSSDGAIRWILNFLPAPFNQFIPHHFLQTLFSCHCPEEALPINLPSLSSPFYVPWEYHCPGPFCTCWYIACNCLFFFSLCPTAFTSIHLSTFFPICLDHFFPLVLWFLIFQHQYQCPLH